MATVKPIQTNFATGEVAPYLQGRIDYDKYRGGARTITNGYVTVSGSVVKRKGTIYQGQAKTPTGGIRLIPFIYNAKDSVILEFGDRYVRFWDSTGQVKSGGNPLEVASPYPSTLGSTVELDKIQYWQSFDVMYLAHPNYPPMKLSRLSATDFTLTQLDIRTGPFLHNEFNGIGITASASTGSGKTLTASHPIFTSDWVGKLVAIKNKYPNIVLSINSANQTGDWHTCYGNFAISITSTPSSPFVGKITLQKSYDGGNTFQDVGVYYGATLQNMFEPRQGVQYRFCCKSGYYVSGSCQCAIDTSDYWGVCKITAVTSLTVATIDILQMFFSTDVCWFWKEGAWGYNRGWPTTVCMFNDRLLFGGTAYQPNTIWGSWIGDYTNFTPGDTTEEASFDFTLGRLQDPIQWLYPWKQLVVGTLTEEATLTPPAGKSISPTTPPNIEIQTNYGSYYSFRPVLADKGLLTVQLNRKRLREFTYSFADDSYVAPDLTQIAKHIGDQRIKQIAYSREPYSSLYCLLDNGRIGMLSYNRYEKVVAWSQFVTNYTLPGGYKVQSNILSVCSVPQPAERSDADWVYIAVRRSSSGSWVTYIERFAVNDMAYLSSNPSLPEAQYGIWEKYYLLDSCMQFNNPANQALTSLSNLSHLDGMTVSVIAYGDSDTYNYIPPFLIAEKALVTSGVVQLGGSYTYTRFLVGVPYSLQIETLNLETASEGVLAQGALKRVIDLTVRTTKSNGKLGFGPNLTGATKIVTIPSAANSYDDIHDLSIPWKEGWDKKGRVCITHDLPYDCHILALMYRAEVNP